MESKSYQNGKIYCIRNTIDDEVYVGSTCQLLSKRMAYHRRDMTGYKKNRKLYFKMNQLGKDKFYIELIEDCPCDNVAQLTRREGQLIRELGTLNSAIAGRTKNEWAQDNEEHIKDKRKQYYIDNKETINAQNKQWVQDNQEYVKVTKKKMYETNKDDIRKAQKQYYNDNKEPILQRNREYNNTHKEQIKESFDKWNTESICPCGGKFHICKKMNILKQNCTFTMLSMEHPKLTKAMPFNVSVEGLTEATKHDMNSASNTKNTLKVSGFTIKIRN